MPLKKGSSQATISENIKTLFDYELETVTKDLFITEFSNFIDSGVAGDTLFFYYNGHGTYTTNANYDGFDDRDEAIITGDGKYIINEDLRTIIRNNLKKDVNLIIVFDCCFNKSFLDLKYEYLDLTRNNYNTINPKYQETVGNVFMISGFSDNKNLSNINISDIIVSGGLSLALKIALGEFSIEVLGSSRVLPSKLIASGFKFNHPDILSTLNSALKY